MVAGSLDDVLARPEAFVEVTLVHDSTAGLSGEAASRIREAAATIGHTTTGVRLAQRGLPVDFVRPVRWRADANLAPMGRQVLQHVGGVLPYLVLVFGFMGAFYAAVDLGAGEKERQTLETLLLTPCSRTHIALGKFLAILTASLAAALLGVLSLMLSVRFLLPAGVMEMLDLRIAPSAWAATGLLMLPAAALFAGTFLAVSIVARSTREAQTYLVPFQFVLLLPAAAPLVPGIELTTRTALIPLVNISLLAREILKGGLDWGYYALTLTTCGALAAAGIAACVHLFGREEVLFRA
jgi:sodium transport system permease protein